MDGAGQAAFLVTSRERLGLPGEALLELPPLSSADSARLFTLRAEAAQAGFAPDAGDQGAIEPLVQLLDGLPLALELAASWLRLMPAATIAAELAGGAGLLVGLAVAPLGMAAAIGLVLYFLGAVGAHAKASDTKGIPPALVLALVSGAALALRIASA